MGYHHFIGSGLKRSEEIQVLVVNDLLDSKVPNDKRESSIQWELKHSSGVIQMARLLAQKRGVNEELAEVSAALHDIYVIVKGNYADHARKGALIARAILENNGKWSGSEIEAISDAVANHSDKQIYGKNALAELVKDADCLDCFFYGDDIYEYKPADQLGHYYRRIINVRRELGLPEKTFFSRRLSELGGNE